MHRKIHSTWRRVREDSFACPSAEVPSAAVLLVGLPPFQADLLRVMLEGQPDVFVAGSLPATAPLMGAISRTSARCILTTEPLNPNLAARLATLLSVHPQLIVLGIAADGAYLYELHPRPVPLGELSPDLLVDLVRPAGTEG